MGFCSYTTNFLQKYHNLATKIDEQRAKKRTNEECIKHSCSILAGVAKLLLATPFIAAAAEAAFSAWRS